MTCRITDKNYFDALLAQKGLIVTSTFFSIILASILYFGIGIFIMSQGVPIDYKLANDGQAEERAYDLMMLNELNRAILAIEEFKIDNGKPPLSLSELPVKFNENIYYGVYQNNATYSLFFYTKSFPIRVERVTYSQSGNIVRNSYSIY